jgi:hypothetical protein
MINDTALQEATLAVRTSPHHPEVWLRLGELLKSRGEITKAEECFMQAEKLRPSSAQAIVTQQIPLAPTSVESSIAPSVVEPVVPVTPVTDTRSIVVASPESIQCSKCKEYNPRVARFCFNCRWALLKPCLRCDEWIPRIHENCIFCGTSQPEAITDLKREAAGLREISEQPLPDRQKENWPVIVGAVLFFGGPAFMFNMIRQADETSAFPFYLFMCMALPATAIVGASMWRTSLVAKRQRIFREITEAVKRYNEIASELEVHEVFLKPKRLSIPK